MAREFSIPLDAKRGLTLETEDTFDTLALIDHEAVQARFACGRELAEIIAPVVASLDQSGS